MKLNKIVILLIMAAFFLSSCGVEPYEVISPCASGKSKNPWEKVPCERRNVNLNSDIS